MYKYPTGALLLLFILLFFFFGGGGGGGLHDFIYNCIGNILLSLHFDEKWHIYKIPWLLFCGNSYYYYYYVFILSAISPYTTGLKALFNQSDCTGTAPTHK